jgi:hypothetical protein
MNPLNPKKLLLTKWTAFKPCHWAKLKAEMLCILPK